MNATQLAALTEKPERVAGTHIVFQQRHPAYPGGGWIVTTKSNVVLGCITWFEKWRVYEFNPEEGTSYEHVCLREIAAFCEAMTKIRKGKV